MKSSAEWKTIEIISEEFGEDDSIYYELTISHDGRRDKIHLARYNDVNELMQMTIGEVIAKYINDYL